MAEQLVESLAAAFEPEKFQDTYREQVLDLIERKAAGEEAIEAPSPRRRRRRSSTCMAALEASVREAKEARTRHPTGSSDVEEDDAAPVPSRQ